MTIEEIVHGESKNVEFKVSLPKDSEKYTKSIVAFANTQGGKLIFGVDDETRKVIGIDEDELFRMMDSIWRCPRREDFTMGLLMKNL